jgi:histidinol dehydrogenase
MDPDQQQSSLRGVKMKINSFVWSELEEAAKRKLLARAESDLSGVLKQVEKITDAVRDRGDEALLDFTAEFDGARLEAGGLRVREEEFDRAEQALAPGVKKAVAACVENVRRFHRRQMPPEISLEETRPGVFAGERFTAVPAAGLYVPRGRGSFPSVMYMLALPALIAGVERVVAVSPPDREGRMDPGTLYAARVCGVKEIYRVGGAQAVAALAYGTATIPRVDKIVGPGSIYVAAAKRLLTGIVDVGPPAGPSEAIVLADESADPRLAALDLMVEAEHGSDSSAYLVTPSRKLARQVTELLPGLTAKLEPGRADFVRDVLGGFGGIIITETMQEAVEFINAYAPEHLQLACSDPFALLPAIHHAGEILLGQNTTFPLANYGVGPNNVLPTGGRARVFSPLTVRDFLKSSSLAYVSDDGFAELEKPVAELAAYEGFSAHARAVTERGGRGC